MKQHPKLSLQRASFQYPGQARPVLNNFELDFESGCSVAILGRSGCGKSTILGMLAGYYHAIDGCCLHDGNPIHSADSSRILISQEDSLWPWLKVDENVGLTSLLADGYTAVRDQRESIITSLKAVQLEPTLLTSYPRQLSAGMKKRVEIARALHVQPSVLLADEPFSALDVQTRKQIQSLLLTIWRNQGLTFIFSTHDPIEALFLANRIIVLSSSLPTTVMKSFVNPFQGDPKAASKAEYSILITSIVDCLME